MAVFSETKVGTLFVVEATGKPQMVALTRTAKELFTTFIDREAKRQGLKVVINASFTDLSLWNSVKTVFSNDPLDASEAKPVGEVIEEGKQVAGSSSSGKFYFSQNTCGLDRFSSGQGDPPSSSCAAVGGLAPIVVDGLPYGTTNMYSAGVPPGAPVTGDVDPKYQKYLVQKSNAMFTALEGRGATVGKVAVGYSSAKQKLKLVVEADGDAKGIDADKVRTMFTIDSMDNAVFMDCSNSTTLWFDGKFEVKPSRHKDEYLDVAVGFK
jgi:exopolysaccharide biosynthesis protein